MRAGGETKLAGYFIRAHDGRSRTHVISATSPATTRMPMLKPISHVLGSKRADAQDFVRVERLDC